MYFESYEQAQRQALHNSKGQLMDCKLYIKNVEGDEKDTLWYIGFTPQAIGDAYAYNGQMIIPVFERKVELELVSNKEYA